MMNLLSKGSAPEPDPDQFVELVTVPAFEAALVVQELQAHDIEVQQVEAFNVVSRTLSDVAVHVRRSQLDRAEQALASN